MTRLLQLFEMESTGDSRYKQRVVIESPVPVKETVGNIHKRLSCVYGNVAVDRRAVGLRAKRVRDGEIGKVQLLDILHQLETWSSRCSGTVKERFSFMSCRQEQQLTQTPISAR